MAGRWKATLIWEITVDSATATENDARDFFEGVAGMNLPAIIGEPMTVRSAVVFVEAVA